MRPVTGGRRHSHLARTCTAGVLAAAFVLLVSNGAIVHDDLAAAHRERAQGPVDWWGLSRVIPGSVAVTEFPAWSLLFGDVHPHVMGIAVLLAVGALCIAWYSALRDGSARPHGPTRDRAGSRHRSDPDDEHLGLPAQHRRDRDDGAARAGGRGAVATSRRPRHRAADRRRPRVVAVRAAGRGLRLWLRSGHVAHPAVQLAEAVRLVRRDQRDGRRRTARRHVPALATGVGMDHARPSGRGRLVARRSGVSVAATRIRDVRDQRVVGTRMRLGRLAASRVASPFSPLGPLTLAIGWAIQAGVEMLTVRNDGGRMNTVFKFWYESWIVLAVGCAVVVAEQLRSRRRLVAQDQQIPGRRFGGAGRRVLVDGDTAAHGRPAERRRVVAGR